MMHLNSAAFLLHPPQFASLAQSQGRSRQLCRKRCRTHTIFACLETSSADLQGTKKHKVMEARSQYSMHSATDNIEDVNGGKSEREILEDIKILGVRDIQDLEEGILQGLASLENKPHPQAEALIREKRSMLDKALQRQRALLSAIESDKAIIKEQAERLRRISKASNSSYFTWCVPTAFGTLLAAASLWHLCDGILKSSPESLQIAAIDLLASMACSYLSWRASWKTRNSASE